MFAPQPRRVAVVGGAGVREPVVVRRAAGLPAQGYRLEVGPSGVVIEAADDAGEFYARTTLAQLPAGSSVVIEDWPDIAVRGVMLDISRDKVPTMDTLCAVVERLASWKVNHLELYMEHTFAYSGHEGVWRDASPITAEEFAVLEEFCAERFVELSVNQNCLGHMERWLRVPAYRELALAPESKQPTTLDPASDAAFSLVAGLLEEIVPLARSGRVHVGLDEPWELLEADMPGAYEGWLRRLRALPVLNGKEMLVWGDVVDGAVPDGVTVCEWNYTAVHPWTERVAPMAERGAPFWVCPGTSSWVTFVGNAVNGTVNCLEAARAAVEMGAAGFMVTDWGDGGHLQPFSSAELVVAYAASVSWCVDANADRSLAALGSAVFDDPSGEMGRALMLLSAAHPDPLECRTRLAEPIYRRWLPLDRRHDTFPAPWVESCLETLRAGVAALARARPARADGALVVEELTNAAALLDVLGRHVLGLVTVGAPPARELAPELEALIVRHRELWLRRNRPGGLDDSAAWLERLLAKYHAALAEL